MSDEIPEPVRRFVAAHIASIAQLEALLLLRVSSPEALSIEQIARKLYCQPDMIGRQLAPLESAGLIKAGSGTPAQYSYQPVNEELTRMVDQVADLYRERRVALTTFIYSDSTYSLRSFADAFRIRKDSNK